MAKTPKTAFYHLCDLAYHLGDCRDAVISIRGRIGTLNPLSTACGLWLFQEMREYLQKANEALKALEAIYESETAGDE